MAVFSERHIGPSLSDQQRMLAALGYQSLDELTDAALPPGTERAVIDLPGTYSLAARSPEVP